MSDTTEEFLSADQIRAGSWWRAADGGKYGCVVLSVNLKTKDATVLGTDGKKREIDTFKLQYRYAHYIPNDGYREGVKTGAEEEVRRRKSGTASHDPTPVESADARLLADCLTRLTDTLEGLKGWKLG